MIAPPCHLQVGGGPTASVHEASHCRLVRKVRSAECPHFSTIVCFVRVCLFLFNPKLELGFHLLAFHLVGFCPNIHLG